MTVIRRLRESGIHVVERPQPADLSVWLCLTAESAALLRAVWGWSEGGSPSAWPVSGRLVRWGAEPPTYLAAPALMLNAASLRLELAALSNMAGTTHDLDIQWSVHTRDAAPVDTRVQFGRRWVAQGVVECSRSAPAYATLESIDDRGWLFFSPLGNGDGVVQAMTLGLPGDAVGLLDEIIRESVLAAPFLGHWRQKPVAVDASPSLHRHFIDGNAIRVGAAAARLDPISGGGVAFSIRSAVLLAAALAEGRSGRLRSKAAASAALRYYENRLKTAFLAHLQTTSSYYGDAFSSAAWHALREDAELVALAERLSSAQLTAAHFALHDYDLVEISR